MKIIKGSIVVSKINGHWGLGTVIKNGSIPGCFIVQFTNPPGWSNGNAINIEATQLLTEDQLDKKRLKAFGLD